MDHPDVHRLISDALRDRAARQLLRARRVIEPIDAVRVQVAGRERINFASNDYLGLAHHPGLREALASHLQQYRAGSGAAGLITGYTPAHAEAESALANWKGTAAAVLLPSGYQANVAAIQTFAALGRSASAAGPLPSHPVTPPEASDAAPGEARRAGVRFLVDKLAHASLIDAIRASGQPYRIFPHNHLSKLERLLAGAEAGQVQVVVTESIFSMDGDAADLPGLAELKQRYGFQLLLDEAHGSGVWGEHGAGYANELGLGDLADVSIVTCSKAMGLVGGVVCGSRGFCDLLLQHGRAYIYSTSVPPFIAAGVRAALEIMQAEPQRQARVRALARHLRQRLIERGIEVKGRADSPIIPIVLGEEAAALDTAARLEAMGLLVIAVRPPTVPRGSSRLRVTVSAEHSDEQVEQLIGALMNLIQK